LQYKNKKNLYKILFIAILLSFTIILVGCNWLSFGLLNIIDPQAQVRINYTDINLTEDEGKGTIALEIYSLNEVEFIGTGFEYDYYNGTTKISSLSKIVGATFYVEPSTSPGTPGPTTTIDLPLYYQEVQDYVTSDPLINEITCTISLIGTDGAGHNITKSVTFNLPIDYFPDISIIVSAVPASFDSTGGISTITAYVVDQQSGQPVGGLRVIFTTDGGILSATSDTTDANGMATVTLTVLKNTSDEDIKYEVTAYVGTTKNAEIITVHKQP
jgi:hypothetical protein